MNSNQVITVNDNDEVIGYLDKMEAHKKGILHRAVSVFIVNSKGEWLIQKRAEGKYHSGLLWSNTACTHPIKDESNEQAAKRRLYEEMGIQTNLKKLFTFQYKATLNNQLIENEYDHVYFGVSDREPVINNDEVIDFRYISENELTKEIQAEPERFTPWFLLLHKRIMSDNLIESSQIN
jgi:isopentenyl-diphosphate delta-isomerase